MKIEFWVNGEKTAMDVPPKKRLMDMLHDDLGLIEVKEGCGKGECGACTVLLNQKRVNSCLVPALQVSGAHIVTVRGLEKLASFKLIENAYHEYGAVQCGFCTTGFLVSTFAFLLENQPPVSRRSIKLGMGGNLCRCTGYTKIVEAVEDLSHNSELREQMLDEWINLFGV